MSVAAINANLLAHYPVLSKYFIMETVVPLPESVSLLST